MPKRTKSKGRTASAQHSLSKGLATLKDGLDRAVPARHLLSKNWTKLRDDVRARLAAQQVEGLRFSRQLRETLELRRDEARAIWYSQKFVVRFVAVTIFFIFSTYVNALGATIAGWRTPDLANNKGLPDIMRDFVLPTKRLQEYLGTDATRKLPDYFVTGHVIIAALVVYFDRRRWTILRRLLVIFGMVSVLRAFCVVATSLPDTSPHCSAQWDHMEAGGSGYYKTQPIFPRAFIRAFKLLADPSITTCGDLVFSGHTVTYVLFSLIVSHYKNLDWQIPPFFWQTDKGPLYGFRIQKQTAELLSILVWVFCFLGMGAILVTEFHYTIDVAIGFYIAHRTWYYYHDTAMVFITYGDANTVSYGIIKQWIMWLEDDGGRDSDDVSASSGEVELRSLTPSKINLSTPEEVAEEVSTPSASLTMIAVLVLCICAVLAVAYIRFSNVWLVDETPERLDLG